MVVDVDHAPCSRQHERHAELARHVLASSPCSTREQAAVAAADSTIPRTTSNRQRRRTARAAGRSRGPQGRGDGVVGDVRRVRDDDVDAPDDRRERLEVRAGRVAAVQQHARPEQPPRPPPAHEVADGPVVRRLLSSTACTTECGTSVASARAIAPDRCTGRPRGAPRRRTTARGSRARPPSGLGAGTNTPPTDPSSRWRNGASPTRCCTGTRAALSDQQRLEPKRHRGVDRVGQEHPAARHAQLLMREQQLGVDTGRRHAALPAALAVDESTSRSVRTGGVRPSCLVPPGRPCARRGRRRCTPGRRRRGRRRARSRGCTP